jgi:hypothetical protein
MKDKIQTLVRVRKNREDAARYMGVEESGHLSSALTTVNHTMQG